MSELGLLGRMVRFLADSGIPYMIAGSFASTAHGAPRATRDIDIVIDPSIKQLETLVTNLAASGCYVDREAAWAALRERGIFNAVDPESGWKVDLIVRKDRPFSLSEFSRRSEAEILGTRAFIAAVEDMIIAKLEWAKLGDSDQQRRDAAGMIAARGSSLDLVYLERWIDALGLRSEWERVRGRL